MSIVKRPDGKVVLWTIGNTQIVADDEPDTGLVPMVKAAALGIAAISTAPVSPVIAIALAGYAALKILDLAVSTGKEGNDIANDIWADVNGVEPMKNAQPDSRAAREGWALMPAEPTDAPPPVGNATRLGAVDVPAQPMQQQAQPSALSALIASPFLSRAFFGAQRTGKSYLAAIASHELSKQGIQIFHINLASFGDEDATYWQHATRSVRADLSSLPGMQAQGFIDAAIDCIHQFFQTRNAILIFDEITLTGSLSNQHADALDPLLRLTADKIACLASTGTKRGQAIWTLSPDFVAGALSQQTKAVKSLALVFVAIAPGRFVDWNGNRIGFHAESFGNVQRNFPVLTTPPRDTGCDRICFVDGKWLTVGDLPSLPKLVVPDFPPTVPKSVEVSDRERLDSLLQSEATHPVENLYHGEADDSELAIRAEIKRYLSANPDGSKPRDLSAKARSPVRKMPTDDIKFILELMTLENEIYEVDGTFFTNSI